MIFSTVLSTRAKAIARASTSPREDASCRSVIGEPGVCAVFLKLHVHYDDIIELPDGPRRALRFNFESE